MQSRPASPASYTKFAPFDDKPPPPGGSPRSNKRSYPSGHSSGITSPENATAHHNPKKIRTMESPTRSRAMEATDADIGIEGFNIVMNVEGHNPLTESSFCILSDTCSEKAPGKSATTSRSIALLGTSWLGYK
ncbi:hypothetical protein RJZ56_003035 [Blastomyces dermatitidis]|uniref:Uncharacterized protein n=3 Tax=Blastomyces TaxID=229219 RepID=A0A179UI13_BLAGS|nr:uncharacterized protein BDBG_02939 [Blastomyces gilchristii SLH14081]XP_045272289.1 uncharacterized protein BDCG_01085 [Blastomyces dermatitidis ER-3]EGE85106.1 hypothetical protein BDDG_08051 [Blastomyces dermatitidis ATCC 18188]EQL33750.1 hypothetical protein BDFG_04284 [Blastomyces dermatitidis ATCC 26199]EEQ84280.1 hypothetical protein BDCG_01085 [Blastomyces dermatitidis ER-3]OAT06777.1 hypothetical protein BDBG_02939 [Blastomyces gilchristii SLH14081]